MYTLYHSIDKHLFDGFSNSAWCLKQGDALSSLIFKVALERTIKKEQENQKEL
jgi:hypothetical protein